MIKDDLLLRQALIQQYANGYAEQIVSLYESGDKRLIAAVRNFFDDATPAGMFTGTVEEWNDKRSTGV